MCVGIFVQKIIRVIFACDISEKVTIGENLILWHSGVPTIGDGTIIGAGAIVLGDIKVGRNVFIGANSVVTQNVPDNVVIAGAPAKILRVNDEPIV